MKPRIERFYWILGIVYFVFGTSISVRILSKASNEQMIHLYLVGIVSI